MLGLKAMFSSFYSIAYYLFFIRQVKKNSEQTIPVIIRSDQRETRKIKPEVKRTNR